MLYLFDPITGQLTETSYEQVSSLTDRKVNNLRCCKSRGSKIKSLGCYLTDDSYERKDFIKLMEKEVISDEYWIEIPNSNMSVSNYGRYTRQSSFICPW